MSAAKSAGGPRKGSNAKAKRGPNLKIPAPVQPPAESDENSDASEDLARRAVRKIPPIPRTGWLRRTTFEQWLYNKGSRRRYLGENGSSALSRASERALGVAVTGLAFFLYLITTAHYQIAGDTPDFLLASKTFGVAHPPGYPTLVMLGHLFSFLPLGSTAFRIDLLAAVCSSATVAFVYLTGLRLTQRPYAAALGAGALAFTPLFWQWSLQIETFPLNNLLVAGVIYFIVRWHQDPQRSTFLYVAGALFAVGLTNQQTILLLAPAIGYVVWLNRRTLVANPIIIGWSVLWIVVGLLPYLYVPLAATFGHSPDNWDHANSVSSFLHLLRRCDYGCTSTSIAHGAHDGSFLSSVLYLLRDLGVVLGITTALGVVASFTRLRWYFVFVAVAFAFSVLEFTVVTGLNPHIGSALFVLERFFLMPMVIVAPLAAVGIVGLNDWLAPKVASFAKGSLERSNDRTASTGRYATNKLISVLVGVAIIAGTIGVVASNYSKINVAHDNVTENYVRDVLSGLPQNAVLFVYGDFANLPILYTQSVEHVRQDVTVVISPILAASWYVEQIRSEHRISVPATVTTRAIVAANPLKKFFFIGPPPDASLKGVYYFASQGLTFEIVPQAQNFDLQTFVNENDTLFATYHVPSFKVIKRDSFEGFILDAYANVPAAVAANYAARSSIGLAIKYYEQAHRIDPRNEVIIKRLNKLIGGTGA